MIQYRGTKLMVTVFIDMIVVFICQAQTPAWCHLGPGT